MIKWQLLERHRDDSTGDSFAWEYNEKYDMQKLANYVKSNLRSEMSQSKRFQPLDTKCPSVTEHSPSQVAIAVPYYSASCF